MSILVDKSTRVLVQGITGGAGSFHARQCIAYGTQVVAGCTPLRGGETFEAKGPGDKAVQVPVFDTVADAVKKTEANTSLIFVPALGAADASQAAEMVQSERIAALCDVAWRRKHGQRPDASRSAPVPRSQDAAVVERVVARLDAIAPLWRALPVGAALVFEWPSVVPAEARTSSRPRRTSGPVTGAGSTRPRPRRSCTTSTRWPGRR